MGETKRIYSAIQPSGMLTLGNYLGALRNFTVLQKDYDCLFCAADMHTLTVRQDPQLLRERTYALMALYLACGLDPKTNILYVQSQVPAHAELAWVLGCYTYMGELARMTQFKDKSARHADNINAGLFTYPVLMAADILLYRTDFVPVGQDQKQHLEIARDIAERFNKLYGPTFRVPEPLIYRQGARIGSLQEPNKKMSKSDDNVNNYILLTDEPDVIRRKFKKAVTDSEGEVRYDEENKPGVSNLINIYGSIRQLSTEEVERAFAGVRYGEFKSAVAEACVEILTPIQENFHAYMADRAALGALLRDNAAKASELAEKTRRDVYEKVGFVC